MSKINILSENLANKIAAGEVVERPASVVKELVENAIDAESRRIFVALSEGGTRLIRVEDDGEGMEGDDARLAFQRHATSKIVREEDLTSIMTLGFRGEALPSIASISKVRLITQTSGATEGTEISLEAGTVQSVKAVGSARGSVFEVRDLFFNLPARKKFLKSAQTELSHISGTLFQLALCHPTIHFRLSHGGRRLLDCPAVSDLKVRFLQLFGRPVTEGSLHVEGGDLAERGLSLSAFFSRPPLRRNHRKEQYLFVNRRPVKSPFLTHAVYEAYGSYLIKGEHPFFALFLTVDPTRVDVNVHPSKKEVRFQENNLVHQTVRGIIRRALSSAGGIDRRTEGPLISEPIASSRSLPSRLNLERKGDPSRGDFILHPDEAEGGGKWLGWPGSSEKPTPPYNEVGGKATMVSERSLPERLPLLSYPPSPSVPVPSGSAPLIRPLGQVYGTFLVAEVEGCLAIVDQHTAHERVLYESLLEDWRRFEDLRGKTDAPSQPFI
ncbi:MAG: DNA mismatch repair endonuclease MutL, partial [Nitrospiria bacterium]